MQRLDVRESDAALLLKPGGGPLEDGAHCFHYLVSAHLRHEIRTTWTRIVNGDND